MCLACFGVEVVDEERVSLFFCFSFLAAALVSFSILLSADDWRVFAAVIFALRSDVLGGGFVVVVIVASTLSLPKLAGKEVRDKRGFLIFFVSRLFSFREVKLVDVAVFAAETIAPVILLRLRSFFTTTVDILATRLDASMTSLFDSTLVKIVESLNPGMRLTSVFDLINEKSLEILSVRLICFKVEEDFGVSCFSKIALFFLNALRDHFKIIILKAKRKLNYFKLLSVENVCTTHPNSC